MAPDCIALRQDYKQLRNDFRLPPVAFIVRCQTGSRQILASTQSLRRLPGCLLASTS